MQVRPPVVPAPAEALPEPEIYVRLAEAMDLFGDPPPELAELAPRARSTPDGAMAFLAAAQQLAAAEPRIAKERLLFWSYRTLGPHLPAPSLAAVWLQCAPERDAPHARACCARSAPSGRSKSAVRDRRPSSSAASSRTPRASRSRASDPETQPRGPRRLRRRARSASRPSRCSPRSAARSRRRRRTDPAYPARPRRRPAHALDGEHDPARPALAEGPRAALRAQPLARRRHARSASATATRCASPHGAARSRCRRRSTRSCMAGHVWMPNGFGMQLRRRARGWSTAPTRTS